MSHGLGSFFKYLAALLMFIFSVSLAYSFFSSIQPPNMPWFVWAAMGLTEFGLLCWIGVFMLTRHREVHKVIALIMVFVCLLTVLFTDAVELARLFHTPLLVAQIYYYVLIGVFAAHLLAFVGDFFATYFEVYPFNSPIGQRQGNLIPAQYAQVGNLIPRNNSQGNLIPKQGYSIEEILNIPGVQDAITGHLKALPVGKERDTEDPLASVSLGQVVTVAKEAVSTLTKKAKGSMKRGKQGGNVLGKTNEITEDTGLQNENVHDSMEETEEEGQ